jgi:hypothetical protein
MCLASALWVRGVSQGLRQRLALAGRRLRGPTGVFAGLAALAFAGVGSWLCWSTNIRNEFISPDQQLDLQAATSASCRSTAACRSRASWRWTTAWTCSRNRSRW